MGSTLQAECYFRSGATLAEGPVWSEGMLYWTDIPGKALYAKPDSKAEAECYDVGLEVGSFALWDGRKMVLATERGFQCLDLNQRRLTAWVNPEEGVPGNRFNDGKCDPRGRFVAGTMNRQGATNKSALYALTDEHHAQKIFGPVTCSNGLAWSEDGTTLYYIDTPSGSVRSFRYDMDTGGLSAERTVIQIPTTSGSPDGMSIDRDGNLWIALWGGWGVECWSPDSGKQRSRIDVPVPCVTSCVFGGSGHETLFITTAKSPETGRCESSSDLAGAIFYATPGTSGFPAARFRVGAGNGHEKIANTPSIS